MANDPVLKMFEIQAELAKLKEESTRIQDQNNELKNQLVVNDLIQTVNDFQTNISTRIETIQENLNALSTRDNDAQSRTISNSLATVQRDLTIVSENVNTLSENVASLSVRVLNHDQILSEISETLKKINVTLNKQSKTLDKQSETLNRQNKTIQILKTNVETETILLLGGYDGTNQLDSLLILESNRESWKELNIKLPCTTQYHGAQFLNNNIYIFGGYNNRDKYLNSTYKLSKSLQWEKMADMNKKRDRILNSNVILKNRIWVCGGQNENGADLNSVERYDPETNKWKYMKKMNECHRDAAAAVVNGKIFCSGGLDNNSVECYDPSSDVWTLICNMPQEIFGHGAVEIDGNLIVMGGIGGWNSVWELDTTDKNAKWIKKSSMSISRYGFSITKVHDKVFVCGGKDADGRIVEIFDGEVWRNGPKMPTTQFLAPAVVIPMQFARSLN